MSGQFRGVQAIIREEFPNAIYVHCSAHSLNLAICHSCTVQPVRNCIGTVSNVVNFFHYPKRNQELKAKVLEQLNSSSTLLSLCETRWVEKHNAAVERFVDLYKPLVSALEELEMDSNKETSSKASQLLNTVTKCAFLVSLCVLQSLFSLTSNLSSLSNNCKQ